MFNETLLPTHDAEPLEETNDAEQLRLYNSDDERSMVSFKTLLATAGYCYVTHLYNNQVNFDKELARKETVALLKNANTCSGMDWSTNPEQSNNVFTAAMGLLPGMGLVALQSYLLNSPRPMQAWNDGDSHLLIAGKLSIITAFALMMSILSNTRFNDEANWTARSVYDQHSACFKEDGSCGPIPAFEFKNFTGGFEIFLGILSFIGAAALASRLVNKQMGQECLSKIGQASQSVTHYFDRMRMRNTVQAEEHTPAVNQSSSRVYQRI